MTYNDVLTAMAMLGDALRMSLSAKALSETLLLRAHYSKGVREWSTMTEQMQKDMPRNEGEADEEYSRRLNELLVTKADEECSLAKRGYSVAAFEELCGACPRDVVERGAGEGEVAKIPAVAWLDYVAANLVEEE